MEIGSIYEINPQKLMKAEERILTQRKHTQHNHTQYNDVQRKHTQRNYTQRNFMQGDSIRFSLQEAEKYGKKYSVYTASGREAIGLSLKSLSFIHPEVTRKCLLPAYMCDTVFFPFEHNGWELYFYHIGKNLQADKEELCRQIEHIRPGLLFIHAYYGVDTWKPMRSLLKQWRKQGLFIMEDVTQSYYLQGIGGEADYVAGSLRKWYPIPDGGFAVSNLPFSDIGLEENRLFTERRLELLTDKWRYLYGEGQNGRRIQDKKSLKEEYLRKNRETEEWLDKHTEINGISDISKEFLKEEDESQYRKIRNDNYRYLLDAMKGMKHCVPVFDREIVPEAPLYFPVYIDDRKELQEFLRKKDIYAPVLWPAGIKNKDYLAEDERYIYDHLLALPIDQRYGRKAMDQIILALQEYHVSADRDSSGRKR